MTLSSAMLVGFTGIQSNQTTVDVVGNNIANANTTAFKGDRTLFETLLYRTENEGTGPSDESGGTLPRQTGTGSGVAAIQKNFSQGSIQETGFAPDLAISGQGFFILNDARNEQVFTRDGAFRLDANNTLVANDGAQLLGFPAGDDGEINTGALTSITIPVGTLTNALATSNVVMDGQLNSNAQPALTGAILTSQPLVTADGSPATANTALTSLTDGSGAPLMVDGDQIVVNAGKGGLNLPESSFEVGIDGSTVGDLTAFLTDALGINTDPALSDGAGVTLGDGTSGPEGALVVTSNLGEANAVDLSSGSIQIIGEVSSAPLTFTQQTAASGDGETTSFQVFDSLGGSAEVRLRFYMESQSDTGTTWRFLAESAGDSDASPVIGTGTITFDPNGQFLSSSGTELTVDRANSGASTPIAFELDLSRLNGLASAGGGSQVTMVSQDGAEPGVLVGYEISPDGTITGTFSNQQSVVLGQVALATFVNEEGLIAASQNRFEIGPGSGLATIVEPQSQSSGAIVSGALEESNVEIVREFVNLISASTGISSASRVVRTADELLQELLLLAR